MSPDWESESPRDCAWCGSELERFGEEPGKHPYWACQHCSKPRRPVLPPRNVGYAIALIRGRIVDPLRPDEYTDTEGIHPTGYFDPDAADPGRFLDRIWDRLSRVNRTIREQDRNRRIEDSGRNAPSGQRQAGLSGWSE